MLYNQQDQDQGLCMPRVSRHREGMQSNQNDEIRFLDPRSRERIRKGASEGAAGRTQAAAIQLVSFGSMTFKDNI